MLKFLCCLLLLIPTIGGATEHTIVRQYVHPLVITQLNDKKDHTIIGSGSAISLLKGYMITAGHIVPLTSSQEMFIIHNERKIKATPIKINRQLDLALLSVNVPCPCASLADSVPAVDTNIVAAGFPLFMTYNLQLLSVGNVQGRHMGNMVTTTLTAPGGSGGGVFYKEKNTYRLAGVTIAIGSNILGPRALQIQQEYNWLTFSVPVDEIKMFLRGTPAENKKAP